VVSSLVLAEKTGGAERRLVLASQSGDGGWGQLPGKLTQRFQNAGNVHVVPRGVTEVRDPWGRVVARGALNAESAIVLPESFRKYKTPLTSVAGAWWPGQYEVRTTYRYDGADEAAVKVLSMHVWYAGTVVVWLGLLGVGALLALAVWWLRRPQKAWWERVWRPGWGRRRR
jgi:hypothetical protein